MFQRQLAREIFTGLTRLHRYHTLALAPVTQCVERRIWKLAIARTHPKETGQEANA